MLEPTVSMEAVQPSELTIQEVITKFIEPHTQAWKDLPQSVREAMMTRPKDFQLIPNQRKGSLPFDLGYNGTVWRHWADIYIWAIHNII